MFKSARIGYSITVILALVVMAFAFFQATNITFAEDRAACPSSPGCQG